MNNNSMDKKALLQTVLQISKTSASETSVAAAVAVEHLAPKLIAELEHGVNHLGIQAVFACIANEVLAIEQRLITEYWERVRNLETSDWATSLAYATSNAAWPLRRIDNTIGNYCSETNVQAAYARMCEASHQVRDVLMNMPMGTVANTSGGSYFVGSYDGVVGLYVLPYDVDATTGESSNDSVEFATTCDGIGEEELDDIAEQLLNWLAAQATTQFHPPHMGLALAHYYQLVGSRYQIQS